MYLVTFHHPWVHVVVCSFSLREVIDLRDDDDEEEDGVSALSISNSPIRSFTPISEATGCLIDFKKQQRAKKPSHRRRWGLKILETRALTKDLANYQVTFRNDWTTPSSWCQILDIYADERTHTERLNVQKSHISSKCRGKLITALSVPLNVLYIYVCLCWGCFRLPLPVLKPFLFRYRSFALTRPSNGGIWTTSVYHIHTDLISPTFYCQLEVTVCSHASLWGIKPLSEISPTSIGRIAVKFFTGFHSPQRMNPTAFGQPLKFPLATPAGRSTYVYHSKNGSNQRLNSASPVL